MKSFKGKIVMITGASSGIGEALAREFSSRGAHVALLARRLDRLESLANELSYHSRAIPIECDVTKDGDLERAMQTIKREFGRVDVVVANAGFGVLGSIEKLSLEDFRRQFETNVFGVLRTVKATVAELKAERGALLIIGSVMGYVTTPTAAPYGMSKFAVRSLAESLDYELGPQGVNVKYIAPGFVQSEIYKVNNEGQRMGSTLDSVPQWLRMPAAKAAKQIVNAIGYRRREVVITNHGKLVVALKRFTPWLMSLVLTKFVRQHRKEAALS